MLNNYFIEKTLAISFVKVKNIPLYSNTQLTFKTVDTPKYFQNTIQLMGNLGKAA